MRRWRDFAQQWALNWSSRALEQVLAAFTDNVVFSSPVALSVTGSAVVMGKEALRQYWMRALSLHHSLRFVVDTTLWNPTTSELAIVYDRDINGDRSRGVELLTFGTEGLIVRGEAFYGASRDSAK